MNNPNAITADLLQEMYRAGNRTYHYKALLSLIRHFPDWDAARSQYSNIEIPVYLIYGEHDWSRPDERKATLEAIPGAQLKTVKGGGHFLSLDAPEDVVQSILDAAAQKTGRQSGAFGAEAK